MIFKPVVEIIINKSIKFHFADSRSTAETNAVVTKFEFDDNDGTAKKNNSQKGRRDTLTFSFLDFDPPRAKLLNSPSDFITDSEAFKIGHEVSCRWGWEGQFPLSKRRIMEIIEINTSYPQGGSEIATVTCHDLSRKLNTEEKNRVLPKERGDKVVSEDKTFPLGQVIKELAIENNMTIGQISQRFQDFGLNGFSQKQETNMQMIQRLAEEYGAETYVEDKELFFVDKKDILKERPWGFIHRGENEEFFNKKRKTRVGLMLNFRPQIKAEKSSKEVESEDTSSKDNKDIKGKSEKTREVVYKVDRTSSAITKSDKPNAVATKDGKSKKGNHTPRSDEDAEMKAEAKQQQDAESTVTASATIFGDVTLVAKRIVISTGRISNRYKGKKWYIKACKSVVTPKSGTPFVCNLDLTSPPPVAKEEDKNVSDKNNKQDVENPEIVYQVNRTSANITKKTKVATSSKLRPVKKS